MRMLLTLCAAGLLALALLVLAAGEAVWVLDLLTFFWPLIALAAVALLVLALVLAGWPARLLALAALAACLVPYLMLPPRPDDAPGERFRVLAANLFVENDDPRRFVALLAREQPDIVVTEETTEPFAEAVRSSGLYPFESATPLRAADDKKVFSRYPIRAEAQLDDLPGLKVGRHALRLVIESPSGPVVFYAIHPDTPRSPDQWRDRNAYLDRLASAVRAEPATATVVLAGDWNLPAFSPYFRTFFEETGYRFARPGLWLPVTRFSMRLARVAYVGSTIDHVAVSPMVRVTGWERGGDIGSNHLPVIVDLALPSANVLAER
jgi:endonuclease/exonuclease/phosphatase (EEP) superfamily protein YafD